jgi:hypothetical protein
VCHSPILPMYIITAVHLLLTPILFTLLPTSEFGKASSTVEVPLPITKPDSSACVMGQVDEEKD